MTGAETFDPIIRVTENNWRSVEAMQKLKEELAAFFRSDEFSLRPMVTGASVRRYFVLEFRRLFYFPQKQVVFMLIPADRLEMADDYLDISYYLRRQNIPRPRLFEIHREKGWIFLAPADGTQLDIFFARHPEQIPLLYPRLVRFLADLQQRAVYEKHCPAFTRFFDEEKFLYEFRFHVREQLFENHWGWRLSEPESELFREFSHTISRALACKKPLFVHRDFQSSNIFYHPANEPEPFQIIDFQDARSGSPFYDLVSLLWDSYVPIPPALRLELAKEFHRNNPEAQKLVSGNNFERQLHYAVIQRKLHDAGAFVYTHRLPGNRRFLKHIRPAVEMALQSMQALGEFEEMQVLLLQQLSANP